MSREDIRQQIAALTAEINIEVARTPLPSGSTLRIFPTMWWIGAAICYSFWQFGDDIPPIATYNQQYGEIIMYIGVAMAVWAALRTLLWIIGGRRRSSAQYLRETQHIRDLQERRRQLEMRLKEMD